MRWAACFILLLVLAIPASCTNLLVNGGFEQGDGGYNGKLKGVGKGWETICGGSHPEIYCIDKKVKRTGKCSQKMSCKGYNVRFTPEGDYCFSIEDGKEVRHPMGLKLGLQAIAQRTPDGVIQPGKKYSCGVWVKIAGLTEPWEWFRLGLYWLDSEGKFISEVREDAETGKANYGTHDWKKIEITATAPQNAAYAKVYLHHHFEHGIVWYDDTWLTALD